MTDEGIGEVVGIINCTLEGAKLVGQMAGGTISMAGTLTRESAKLMARLMKLMYQVSRYMAVDRKYNKTSGKTSEKVLQTKFQNLEYDEVKFTNAKEKVLEMCKGMDEKKLSKIADKFDEKTLCARFDTLARKNGLLYCKIPNFVENEDTGKIEYRYTYPAEQAKANAETRTQFAAYINKLLRDIGIKDMKPEEIVYETVPAGANMPLLQATERLMICQCSDEDFEAAMSKCYPDYEAGAFVPKEPEEEKKRSFSDITEKNEIHEKHINGNIRDMTVPLENIVYQSKEKIKFVHPWYANVLMTVKPEDVVKEQIIESSLPKMINITIKRDNAYECDVIRGNSQTNAVKHGRYQFNPDELDKFMKAQNLKARSAARSRHVQPVNSEMRKEAKI